MLYEATESLQDLAPTVAVGLVCLWRLVRYIRRRRDARYENWQPVEIVALRAVVMVLTGKPMTPRTWQRINLVVVLLIVALLSMELYDARHPVPLRRLIWERLSFR
jgi:enoyl-CoA hydratase/carnithine racemase